MASVLGVELETGLTFGYDKYNWQETTHFITEECDGAIDFGQEKNNIYALQGASVLKVSQSSVQLAANEFGAGRAVYISGLPYSPINARLLHRAVMWCSHGEKKLREWFSSNCNVDVHAYENGSWCAVNNSSEPQVTTAYTKNGDSQVLSLDANEIRWFLDKE